jgi:hypothetical protein
MFGRFIFSATVDLTHPPECFVCFAFGEGRYAEPNPFAIMGAISMVKEHYSVQHAFRRPI